MSDHPDQESRNIREINAHQDPTENETTAETEAREAREAEEQFILPTPEELAATPFFVRESETKIIARLEKQLLRVTDQRDSAEATYLWRRPLNCFLR